MDIEKRPIILQQVTTPKIGGGIATEFKSLMNSDIVNKYELVPIVLSNIHKGVNIKDINHYYTEMIKYDFAIVHIRGAQIDSLNAIIAAKRLKRGKIITTIHGLYSDKVNCSRIKKIIARYIVEPLIFKLSDYIVCLYENGKNMPQLKKFQNKVLPHVYNRYPQFDLSSFNIIEVKTNCSITSEDFVFTYSGRIEKDKGLDFYCDAILEFDKIYPCSIKYIFVGDGKFTSVIKEKLGYLIEQNKVILTGLVNDVFPYLLISNVSVNPTLRENHSISILESIISKTPSIVTNVGGNAESIRHNINGLVIPPFSKEKLVESMLLMYENKDLYSKFKQELNNIDQRFTSENIDKRIIEMYELVLDKNVRNKSK